MGEPVKTTPETRAAEREALDEFFDTTQYDRDPDDYMAKTQKEAEQDD